MKGVLFLSKCYKKRVLKGLVLGAEPPLIELFVEYDSPPLGTRRSQDILACESKPFQILTETLNTF